MYIGIDLGGTNIAIGLVDDNAHIIASSSRPTRSERTFDEIVRNMAEISLELLEQNNFSKSDLDGIGIGSPGMVDNENGVIVYANNLNWKNVPLKQELKKYFDVPISVENDANAAAYGAYIINNDKTVNSFIAITLGTGVGGGIVLDKKIYRGFNGSGGELGHIVINVDGEPCTCGNNGCWEAYASVTALVRQTKEAIKAHPESSMASTVKVNGLTSFNAAKSGDTAGQAVVDRYIEYIACGITNIINIFQPEILVIGGGISKEGDYLLNPIKDYVKKHIYCKEVKQTEIKIASLNDEAGIIGAAFASKSDNL